MMWPPKLTKVDARQWLTAMGESVTPTMSSGELKVKLSRIINDTPRELLLPVMVNSMPQSVLNKFKKWIIFQQKQAAPSAHATPCMVSLKEEALSGVFNQVKLLQQMDMRLGDIVSRIVDRAPTNDEARSFGLQTGQS
jgi:hypothetical protein